MLVFINNFFFLNNFTLELVVYINNVNITICQQPATTTTTDPANTITTVSATTTTAAPTTTTTEGSPYDCTGDKQKQLKYFCYKSQYLDLYLLFQFLFSTD